MFFLSPLLSLVVVVFIPLFAYVAIRFRDLVFPASWNDQRLSGAVAGVVDEAVTGVRVVKAFAQEDREFDRLIDRAHELYQSRMRTARYNARYSSTLQALPMLGQLGVLAVGGCLAFERPHHPRRVPRLRQLPRADHHAGAPRVEHAVDHAAGPRRCRAGVRAARPAAPRRRPPRRPARRSPARRDRRRARQLRLRGRPGDAARRLPLDPAGRADRARRRVGLGQDHAGLPDRPLLRPDRRRGAPRRHRPAPAAPPVAALGGQRRVRGELPVLGVDPREHRLRPARRERRRHRGGRPRGAGPRVHPRAVARLRHGRRRTGLHPVGRSASAHRARPAPPSPTPACSSSTTPPRRSMPVPRRRSTNRLPRS